MKVVLTENVKNIGQKGEEKEVKPGFARNYLFKNKLAIPAASPEALILLEQKEKKEIESKGESEKIKSTISKYVGKEIVFNKKASAEGKLFAGINQKEIIEKVEELLGFKISSVELEDPIKSTGEYVVMIHFKSGDEMKLAVKVLAENTGK